MRDKSRERPGPSENQANFNDALMETAHKLNKSQSLLFSRGKTGPILKSAYQKQVIKQQFQNEAFQLTSRENTPQKSSSAKAERKRQAMIDKEPIAKKVVITKLLFQDIVVKNSSCPL